MTKLFYSNPMDLFDSFFLDQISSKPKQSYPYNIYYDGDDAVIEVALAGFSKEEVDVSVIDSEIIISAEHKKEDDERSVDYVHHGISKRDLKTKFKIGSMADIKKIKCKFIDGMLKVEIPHKPKDEFSVNID